MTGYTDGGNTANNATYTYGADGLRTSKTVNGTKTTYIWSGGNIVAEITGSKYTVYLYGLNRISRGIIGTKYAKSGTAYDRYHELYLYDGHGNVVQTADEGITDYMNAVHYGTYGNVVPEMDINGDDRIDLSDLMHFLNHYPIINSYHYDAFGNQLDENTPSNTNPFRYCGEYWDKETGDIYLRARYYNPTAGRFTTVDPAMDGVNWYVYCKGNPISFVDPWGLKIYLPETDTGRKEWNCGQR